MEFDSLGLYDIYGLHHVPFWQQSWFWYCCIGTGLFIAVLSIIGICYMVKRKKQSSKKPWEQALDALALLKKQEQAAKSDKAYDELFCIIREYVQNRFAVDCQGKTDQELCVLLDENILFDPTKKVSCVLRNGVTIKFGHRSTDQKQYESDYKAIVTFVQTTIPQDTK